MDSNTGLFSIFFLYSYQYAHFAIAKVVTLNFFAPFFVLVWYILLFLCRLPIFVSFDLLTIARAIVVPLFTSLKRIKEIKQRKLRAITLQEAKDKSENCYRNTRNRNRQLGILYFGWTNIIFVDYSKLKRGLVCNVFVRGLGGGVGGYFKMN